MEAFNAFIQSDFQQHDHVREDMSCNRITLTKSPETPGLGCGMGASGEIRGTFPSMPLLFTEENSDLSGILQGRIQVQNGKSSG